MNPDEQRKLAELIAERDTLKGNLEREFMEPSRAGREPVYGWWKHKEDLEDIEERISKAAHNAVPALLDALEAAEAERDRLAELTKAIDRVMQCVERTGDKNRRTERIELKLGGTVHVYDHGKGARFLEALAGLFDAAYALQPPV